MKHTIPIILTMLVILSLRTGCGAAGKQSSTVAENEKKTVLTVRIENQSAVNLYGIAASYSANGETLGSKVCEQIDKNAEQVVYEFDFFPDELPAAAIDAFQLDVFAVEKAGEDYSNCGSAVIKSPQLGGVYTLALNGADAAALTLSTIEGSALTADVSGELADAAYRITLHQPEPEKLVMIFKEIELVWTYGDGGSLRGED